MSGHEPPVPPGVRSRGDLGRRDLLRGFAAAGIGTGAGFTAGWTGAKERAGSPPHSRPADHGLERVPATGEHQAGIASPSVPQPNGFLLVADLAGVPVRGREAAFAARLRGACATLGEAIAGLTSGATAEEAGLVDGPGDLTVTVGLGPRVVTAIDPTLPGAQDLPSFAGDEAIPRWRRGGDVLLAAYSSDPTVAEQAARWLAGGLPGAGLRWTQRCFRAPGSGTVARNPLGFPDGIIVPRTEAELDEHVWIPDGPMGGGTICVVRRLRLDIARFRAEALGRQEAVIGRHRKDGSPLSGGGPTAEADLMAKLPEGTLVTPARSHVRAAHPSFTGSHLMLRRGYSYDDGVIAEDPAAVDAGLMFVCFQRDLRTFVDTQHRLDETDDLMGYVTPTASATFVVLPGFDARRPLGATLSAR